MEIREEQAGDVLVLAPNGDLSSTEDCQALEQRLSAAVSAGARYLVVDCAGVGHVTSPALRALLLASRKLSRVQGRLVLCGMTPKVQKAFSISGFDRDFTALPAREAAVRAALEAGPAVAAKAGPRREQAAPAPGPQGAEAPAAPCVAPAGTLPAISRPAASLPEATSEPPAPAASAPQRAPTAPTPDPRIVLASRLLVALHAEGADPTPPPVAEPPEVAAAHTALAAALARIFDIRPA